MGQTRAKTIDELPHGFESGLARFFQKIHFTFLPRSLCVTLDKPFSSKSISSVSPSAPCKYIIRVLLYGATSLQMNFLERFLPPSGRQAQKRRARRPRGGGRGRERGNVVSGRGGGCEERMVKWRTARKWRGGKEEVGKKTSRARDNS